MKHQCLQVSVFLSIGITLVLRLSSFLRCREGPAKGKVTLSCASHCAGNRPGQEQNGELRSPAAAGPLEGGTGREGPGKSWIYKPDHVKPASGAVGVRAASVGRPANGTSDPAQDEARALKCLLWNQVGAPGTKGAEHWTGVPNRTNGVHSDRPQSDQHPGGSAVQSSTAAGRNSPAPCHQVVPFPPTAGCGELEITVLK